MVYSISDISKDIYKSVECNTVIFTHKSLVIVGDNSSGKTTLLKNLLAKIRKENDARFYFIDALNRIVYGSDSKNQESELRYSDYTPFEILKERSSASYMSKEDIFPRANKGYLVTYSELCSNIEGYEKILNNFFNCKIKMQSVFKKGSLISGSSILAVNDKTVDSLSSSEAARIRIIMEIEYAKKCNCKMVIIDEFDNSFDSDNQVKLMQQLQANYPELRFIFVIHNFALLVQLSGMDAIMFNNTDTAPVDINMVDCDDITAIGEVNRIRAKYIGERDKMERFLSSCITELLKNRVVPNEQLRTLNNIDRNKLTIKNRILYDYVMERKK